jgi:hypothetical protein
MKRTWRILIYSIMNLINFPILILLLIKEERIRLPFDLSFHCMIANFFYFFSLLSMEIREEIWEIYYDKCLPFLRNEIFKFLFVFNFFSFFIYYGFILLGPNFKTFPHEKMEIFFTIFLNGGQLIFILTEFLIADHEHIPRYFIDSVILLSYFKLYLLFCLFGAKKYNIYPFEFIKNATGPQYFVAFLVCKIILVNYYYVYQGLLIKKKDFFNENELDKDEKKKYLPLDDANNCEMQVKEFDNCNSNQEKNNEINSKVNQELYKKDNNNKLKKEKVNGTIKIYNDA